MNQNLLQKLKTYFEKREDVVMAFVFGSRVEKNKIHGHSDWDIAVYFQPEKKDPLDPSNTRLHGIIEWEEQNREYPAEDEVWEDVMDILKTDNVDLIVLNRASASIADSAIQGFPLVIKDRDFFLDFMLAVRREAEDFNAFIHDYYEVYERSKSLTEKDKRRLEKIIIFFEEQLSRYNYFNQFNEKDYTYKMEKRGDAERWIENIINAAIDISEILLSSQKKLIPSSYRETMERIVWLIGLPDNFREKFAKWAKLRNILAHEYLDIKWKRISDFIQTSEPHLQEFTEKIKEFLNKG